MGILAERIERHPQLRLLRREAAALVEREVCAKMGIAPDSQKLRDLALEGGSFAGRKRVGGTIVSIATPGKYPLKFALKDVHKITEPEISRIASDQGVGPKVLGVFGEGKRAEILEEYFSYERCISQGHKLDGSELTRFFLRFFLSNGQLLNHRDERPEHVYVIENIGRKEARLIDWGRGSICPETEFIEWASGQFRWFYHILCGNNPFVWRDFINSLSSNARTSRDKIVGRLAVAYIEFMKRESHAVFFDGGRPDRFAGDFLSFQAQAQPFNLKLGPINDFFAVRRDDRPIGLAFHEWWGCHSAEVQRWREQVLI